jgi:hypothetical protein
MYENPTTERLMVMKAAAFAYFSAIGTWASIREPCKACGWHWQVYSPPLLMQWERSTDLIGDFSWDGPFGYLYVVRENVATKLHEMQFDCSFLPTEYVPLKRKLNMRQRTWYPHESPNLLWGVCDTFVDLDMKLSSVELISSCSVCGAQRFTFRNNGIVIRRRNWRGNMMFRVTTNSNSLATFVTEQGRKLIQKADLSNVAFSEAGEII